MSFGTLELLVEINQSRANSSAKSVAASMSAIIKEGLKDCTKDIFSSIAGDSKSASESAKANLLSINGVLNTLQQSMRSTFVDQSFRVNVDTNQLNRAETQVSEIHQSSNNNVQVHFSSSGLGELRSSVESTVASIRSKLDSIGRGMLQGLGREIFHSLVDGVKGAVGVVEGAMGTFTDFSSSLNQFGVFSGATAEEVKALGDTARQLAMDTSTTATGASKAAIEMVKLGFSASETKDQLKGVVSLAESTGMTDMGKAAEIAGAAYAVFGISAEKTADIVSSTANNSAASAEDMLQVLSKTGGVAKATGQSVETLSTAFGLMRNSGFTAESAATGLKTALLRLAAPSNEGRNALKTLGVEAYDANGKMKPLLSMLPEFKSALSGFDDASKMDLTKKIFGDRGGPAFLAMMNQSQEKVDELYNKISNSDGSAKSSAAKLLEGLPGALKLAKGSIENLALGLGDALSPALEAIIRLGVDVANTLGKGDMFASIKAGATEFASYLKDNKQLVTDIVLGIQQLALAMGTQLTVSAKDFTDYMKANPDAMKTLIVDIGNAATSLGQLVIASVEFGKGFAEASLGMVSMLVPMVDFVSQLTGASAGSASLAENLGKAAAYVIPLLLLGSLVGTIETIVGGVTAIVGLFGGWAVLGTTITGIMAGIGSTIASILVTIGGLVAGTITFAEVWATVIAGINPVGLAIAAIGITIYNIIQYTKNWDDVVLGFQQTVTDLKNIFKEVVRWIVNAIGQSENFENIWKVIKELIIAVCTPFGLITKIIDTGVEKTGLFKNEWNAIKELATGVGNAFKNIVGGVFDGLIKQAQSLGNQLKSMIGMGGNNGGVTAVGGSASEGDKYVGAVLSILESPTRQGRVDVAQVIANRTQSNFGGNGSTIRDQGFASGQFEPFFNDISKGEIQNKDTAIKALQKKGYSAKQASEALDQFFIDVADSAKVSDSASKVGGRQYFKGTSQYGNMGSGDFLRQQGENFFHHEGSGNREQGSISSLFGSAGNGGGFGNGARGIANAVVPTGTLAAQEYGAARGGGREHAGQDFDLGDDDKFQSYIGGTVTQVGNDPGGYFKWLDIFNEKLQRVERVAELDNLNVKVGDRVAPGQVVGSGTQATGVVHYEIRTDADSSGKGGFGKNGTVDPVRYLESIGIIKREGTNLIPQKGGTNSGTSVKEEGHFDGDGHNHGGSSEGSNLNYSGQVIVNRIGEKDDQGLEKLMVRVFDQQGKMINNSIVNSGKKGTQGNFGGAGTTRSGSNSPLEYGNYSLGTPEDASDVPGMGSNFIAINPKFATERSLLGIHRDGDRNVPNQAGSAGCIVFKTEEEFQAFQKSLLQSGAKNLKFESGKAVQNTLSSGGNGAAVGEANDEISGLRSTVKEEEAAKAEKEADKLAKKQEAADRKNQKAIESAAKMQDQGLDQKRKTEKETRQLTKDERIQGIDRQLATTTNSDAKSALENTKKKISVGFSESEKIIEGEQKIENLKKARERKVKDGKSPLEDVREKASQMPDYSQAIKDEEKLLTARRKLRNEMEVTASLEFDTANKTKNDDQSKVTLVQNTTEAYNKEKRMLEELKTLQAEDDPTQVKKTELLIRRLDLQQANTLALIEEESKLKKAKEARDEYNKALEKSGGKPDDTLKRLNVEIDNIEKKVLDINADKKTKLRVIDLEEIKNVKELAKALDEVRASKEGVQNASKVNLSKARSGILRQEGDEFGANAMDRASAKQEQTIKNRDRLRGLDKEIEDKSKTQLPYSVEEIRTLKSEANELNKIEFSQAGSQFKTLGETIGTTFKESVGSALKDVLTGAKSMGEAFQDVISNMLSKLAELAVNSLLKDLMGGMFSGGGGGGIFGNLLGGLFGGGNSEGGIVPSFSMGGIVPNYADGNLSTIGGNRPYLAGEPFKAAKNSPIARALQREGSGGVVSVLKANELVLNPSQTRAFFAMGMDQQLSGSVNNYAEGNLSSFGGSVTTSSSDNVTIPITINMSGNGDKDKSGLNIPRLQEEVRKTVIAEIQSQQRNGGGLAK